MNKLKLYSLDRSAEACRPLFFSTVHFEREIPFCSRGVSGSPLTQQQQQDLDHDYALSIHW
jgi:hypothetical protein